MALTQEQLNRILGKQSVVDRVLSTNAIEKKLNAPENIVTGGILPIQKNKVTGQMSWAMPEFIKSMQQAYTAPARAMRGEFDPNSVQGVQEANNVALNLLGVGSAPAIGKPRQQGSLGITAYHGSPYNFEKFSLEKIGTGEGSQAQGHGLYFAENPDVAKTYMKKSNNLYKVDIADESIPNMLNWDKPIGTQENILEKLGINNKINRYNEINKKIESMPSQYDIEVPKEKLLFDEYMNLQKERNDIGLHKTGADYYESLIKKYGSDKNASNELNNLGIKGIKYIDSKSKGTLAKMQDTPMSNNYVVFDPEIVKILKLN